MAAEKSGRILRLFNENIIGGDSIVLTKKKNQRMGYPNLKVVSTHFNETVFEEDRIS